jgi:hypothetical protein
MHPGLPAILDLRRRSLARANILVLSSFCAAVLLSDFPHSRATLLLLLPTAVAVIGLADTVRCMRRRWNFYHAGVILCIYMDLMAIAMILFFLIYPYSHGLGNTH